MSAASVQPGSLDAVIERALFDECGWVLIRTSAGRADRHMAAATTRFHPRSVASHPVDPQVDHLCRLVGALLPAPSEMVVVSATRDIAGRNDPTAHELVQESMSIAICGPLAVAWLAEEKIGPDDMPFLFYSGSHVHGQLPNAGRVGAERWPQLRECEITAPRHMNAGDMIVFHGNTVFARVTPSRPVHGWRIVLAPAESVTVHVAADAAVPSYP